jgi:hypothetical protein
MSNLSRQQAVDAATQYLSEHASGYFVTLNSLSKDRIKFNQQLQQLTTWLNEFCYGSQFRRKEIRLKIVTSPEQGLLNEGLHAHLVITYSSAMTKSHQEINAFIRRKWYRLIGASGSIFGTLVHVEPLVDLEAALNYSLKDFNKYSSDGLKVTFL